MDKIIDGIYIGNSSDASNETYLKNNGITAILNVAKDLNISTQFKKDKDWYSGILSLKIGMGDCDYSGNKINTENAVLVIDNLLKNGYTIMIHCHQGRNRSPFVVANYLAFKNKTNWEKEFEFIKSKRSECFTKDWMYKLDIKI